MRSFMAGGDLLAIQVLNMNGLLRALRKLGLVCGYALLWVDNWMERLFIGAVVIAMIILSIAIAWGLIEGRYSIVSPYRY